MLLAAGAVFQEFAQVSYNAMLPQISNPGNIGKISGIGWGAGYIGGIVVLLLAYLLFVKPDVGLFGVTAEGGLKFRALALVVAVWFAVWSIPTFRSVPEIAPTADIPRVGFLASYKVLIGDVRALFKADRHSVWFLLASALYRDGLVAIFSLGGVLAVSVYGLTKADVVIFGVAANVIAAIGAFAAGIVEDRAGAKPVIMVSLAALVAVSVAMLFAHGPTQFWILALILCLWVGPAQSASRTYLARLAPGGPRGTDVRPVRDHRPSGVVPRPRPVRAVLQCFRLDTNGYLRNIRGDLVRPHCAVPGEAAAEAPTSLVPQSCGVVLEHSGWSGSYHLGAR